MAFPVKPEAALASCFRNILQDMHPILNSKDLVSFWGIDGELESLQKILKRIQDVLNDAEWRSQTEGSVSDWMEDLRELLYCIEDLVDDMNIERVRMEKQLAALNHHSPGHQAANEYTIWDIMADYTSQKKTISESIKKIIVKLQEVAKDAEKLNLKPQTLAGTPVASFVVKDGDDIGPLVDESEVYGRQEDKDHVIELLMSPNDSSKNYSVVSIVGMGGVGKTTLARFVFQDKRVENYFDMQSWACVSYDFDFNRVVRELIEYAADKENTSKTTTGALLDRLKRMVAAKKVLFVLDDMWTVEAWEKLRAVFARCAKGSKILVTTRDKNIGNAIKDEEIYQLQTLKDEHCWVLFKEKAFCGVVDERLESIGIKIVERCKGVPLAVKVIGSSLLSAPKEMWESTLKNEIWQSMDEAKNGIFPVLKLSYHYLPSSLKRCFQYFSVFPTNFPFRRDELVRLWIAEGLIESREGRTLEDIGCSYYIELQRRCLVEKDDRMHDLLHSLACLVSGKFFSRPAKDSKSRTHLGSVRHLSLINTGEIEMFNEATCLRTLLVFDQPCFDAINLKQTRFLRVLDLCNNYLWEPLSSVGNLKYLRYLNLSGCSNLQSLPKSICELHNLQILDLSYCSGMRGTALPTEMGNLQNLRYLCLFRMEYLSALPSSIVKLSNLLTLNLNGCQNLTCIPDNNIGGLQSLQILDLTDCRSLSHLPNEIGDLRDLRELSLRGSSISCLPESICNIRNLRVLDIYGCTMLMNSLPRNLGNLTCIEKLERFVVGREEGHGIEELRDMNKLQGKLAILNLENVDSVEHALMANLKKKALDEIEFVWSSAFLPNEGHDSINVLGDDDISDVVDRELEASVLDALEPHPTSLEALSFLNYRGGRIPKWMSTLSFPILTSLVMIGLEGINRMVDLELPSLEWLEIVSCLKLKDVSMGVPNLFHLEVLACRDLTTLSMSPSLGNSSSSLASTRLDLPQLVDLDFNGCSSLRDIHMMMVPLLEELKIEDCKELKMIYTDRMPNLEKLTLKSLPNLMLHPGSSTELPISSGCEHKLISMVMPFDCEAHGSDDLLLPEEGGGMFPKLEHLDVEKCPKLQFSPEGLSHLTSRQSITFSCQEVSLENLSSLEDMVIRGFAGKVRLWARVDAAVSTSYTLPPKLEELEIENCPNLTLLPKALHTFASLRALRIRDCPELVSFPETGLPPLLEELKVSSCKNLQYFPARLNDHSSLRYISFENCEQVEARPDDGPPPNFFELKVSNCPKLEQQIKQHRKDWLAKTHFMGEGLLFRGSCTTQQ